MLRVAFSHLPLPMGGLYDGGVTGFWGIEASHGDVSKWKSLVEVALVQTYLPRRYSE